MILNYHESVISHHPIQFFSGAEEGHTLSPESILSSLPGTITVVNYEILDRIPHVWHLKIQGIFQKESMKK